MIFKKIIAIFTVAAFVFSFVISQPLQAVVEQRRSAESFKTIFEDFIIPTSLGRITDVYEGRRAKDEGRNVPRLSSLVSRSSPLVINIQDLHCHPEVQQNISKIIELLDIKYRLKNVYIEGASGPVDSSWLSNIKEENLKQKIMASLLEEGKLTGAEYYSVMSGKTDLLAGADNAKLHAENIVRLNKITSKQEFLQKQVTGLKDAMLSLKKKYFCSGNVKLDKMSDKFKSGKLAPKKYYEYLIKTAKKQNIDVDYFPNLLNFSKSYEIAGQLKYDKVGKQLQQFVSILKQKLPYNEYKILLENTNNFTKLNELYGCLSKIAHSPGITVQNQELFPDLFKFFEYVELSQNVNPIELINEEQRLIYETRVKLTKNEMEREIVFLSEFTRYIGEFLSFSISANDYDYFKSNLPRFNLLWAQYLGTEKLDELKPYFAMLDEYYMVNLERNGCFVKSIGMLETKDKKRDARDEGRGTSDEKNIQNNGSITNLIENADNVIVLVTGGFHTPGVCALLKQQNVPYVVITPNATKDTKLSESVYEKLLAEQAGIFAKTTANPALRAGVQKFSSSGVQKNYNALALYTFAKFVAFGDGENKPELISEAALSIFEAAVNSGITPESAGNVVKDMFSSASIEKILQNELEQHIKSDKKTAEKLSIIPKLTNNVQVIKEDGKPTRGLEFSVTIFNERKEVFSQTIQGYVENNKIVKIVKPRLSEVLSEGGDATAARVPRLEVENNGAGIDTKVKQEKSPIRQNLGGPNTGFVTGIIRGVSAVSLFLFAYSLISSFVLHPAYYSFVYIASIVITAVSIIMGINLLIKNVTGRNIIFSGDSSLARRTVVVLFVSFSILFNVLFFEKGTGIKHFVRRSFTRMVYKTSSVGKFIPVLSEHKNAANQSIDSMSYDAYKTLHNVGGGIKATENIDIVWVPGDKYSVGVEAIEGKVPFSKAKPLEICKMDSSIVARASGGYSDFDNKGVWCCSLVIKDGKEVSPFSPGVKKKHILVITDNGELVIATKDDYLGKRYPFDGSFKKLNAIHSGVPLMIKGISTGLATSENVEQNRSWGIVFQWIDNVKGKKGTGFFYSGGILEGLSGTPLSKIYGFITNTLAKKYNVKITDIIVMESGGYSFLNVNFPGGKELRRASGDTVSSSILVVRDKSLMEKYSSFVQKAAGSPNEFYNKDNTQIFQGNVKQAKNTENADNKLSKEDESVPGPLKTPWADEDELKLTEEQYSAVLNNAEPIEGEELNKTLAGVQKVFGKAVDGGQWTVKGKNRESIENRVHFYVASGQNPLPENINALGRKDADGNLVVIVSHRYLTANQIRAPDTEILEKLAEIVDHEWTENIQLESMPRTTAHREAASRQKKYFSKNETELTPYHNWLIKTATLAQLQKLADEYKSMSNTEKQTRGWGKYEELFNNKVLESINQLPLETKGNDTGIDRNVKSQEVTHVTPGDRKYSYSGYEIEVSNQNKNYCKTSAGAISVGMSMSMRLLYPENSDYPGIIIAPSGKWTGEDGSNLMQLYFSIMCNFSIHKRKTKIVCTEHQKERIIKYLQLGNPYYLPNAAGYSEDLIERFRGEAIYLADRADVDGKQKIVSTYSDMVEFVMFSETGVADVGGVTVADKGNGNFTVIDGSSQYVLDSRVMNEINVNISGVRLLAQIPDFGITFLGTSSGIDVNGLPSSHIVWAGKNHILTDVCTQTIDELKALGLKPSDITHVLLTHVHEDHIGGLLVYLRWCKDKNHPVKLLVEPGIYQLIKEQTRQILDKNIETVFDIEVIPLRFYTQTVIGKGTDAVTIETAPAFHGTPSTMMRIDYKGRTISHSGDTAFDPVRNDKILSNDIPANVRDDMKNAGLDNKTPLFDSIRAGEISKFLTKTNDAGQTPDLIVFDGGTAAGYETNNTNHTSSFALAKLPAEIQKRLVVNHSAKLPEGKFDFSHAEPFRSIALIVSGGSDRTQAGYKADLFKNLKINSIIKYIVGCTVAGFAERKLIYNEDFLLSHELDDRLIVDSEGVAKYSEEQIVARGNMRRVGVSLVQALEKAPVALLLPVIKLMRLFSVLNPAASVLENTLVFVSKHLINPVAHNLFNLAYPLQYAVVKLAQVFFPGSQINNLQPALLVTTEKIQNDIAQNLVDKGIDITKARRIAEAIMLSNTDLIAGLIYKSLNERESFMNKRLKLDIVFETLLDAPRGAKPMMDLLRDLKIIKINEIDWFKAVVKAFINEYILEKRKNNPSFKKDDGVKEVIDALLIKKDALIYKKGFLDDPEGLKNELLGVRRNFSPEILRRENLLLLETELLGLYALKILPNTNRAGAAKNDEEKKLETQKIAADENVLKKLLLIMKKSSSADVENKSRNIKELAVKVYGVKFEKTVEDGVVQTDKKQNMVLQAGGGHGLESENIILLEKSLLVLYDIGGLPKFIDKATGREKPREEIKKVIKEIAANKNALAAVLSSMDNKMGKPGITRQRYESLKKLIEGIYGKLATVKLGKVLGPIPVILFISYTVLASIGLVSGILAGAEAGIITAMSGLYLVRTVRLSHYQPGEINTNHFLDEHIYKNYDKYKLLNYLFLRNGIDIYNKTSVTPDRLASFFNEMASIPDLIQILAENSNFKISEILSRIGRADPATILKNKKKISEMYPLTLNVPVELINGDMQKMISSKIISIHNITKSSLGLFFDGPAVDILNEKFVYNLHNSFMGNAKLESALFEYGTLAENEMKGRKVVVLDLNRLHTDYNYAEHVIGTFHEVMEMTIKELEGEKYSKFRTNAHFITLFLEEYVFRQVYPKNDYPDIDSTNLHLWYESDEGLAAYKDLVLDNEVFQDVRLRELINRFRKSAEIMLFRRGRVKEFKNSLTRIVKDEKLVGTTVTKAVRSKENMKALLSNLIDYVKNNAASEDKLEILETILRYDVESSWPGVVDEVIKEKGILLQNKEAVKKFCAQPLSPLVIQDLLIKGGGRVIAFYYRCGDLTGSCANAGITGFLEKRKQLKDAYKTDFQRMVKNHWEKNDYYKYFSTLFSGVPGSEILIEQLDNILVSSGLDPNAKDRLLIDFLEDLENSLFEANKKYGKDIGKRNGQVGNQNGFSHAGFWLEMAGSKKCPASKIEEKKQQLQNELKNQILPEGYVRHSVKIGDNQRVLIVTNYQDSTEKLAGFINESISIRGPDSDKIKKAINGKELILDFVEQSPNLGGNCLKDGYIYINTSTPETLYPLVISHELMHEAGVEDEALIAQLDNEIIQINPNQQLWQRAINDLVNEGLVVNSEVVADKTENLKPEEEKSTAQGVGVQNLISTRFIDSMKGCKIEYDGENITNLPKQAINEAFECTPMIERTLKELYNIDINNDHFKLDKLIVRQEWFSFRGDNKIVFKVDVIFKNAPNLLGISFIIKLPNIYDDVDVDTLWIEWSWMKKYRVMSVRPFLPKGGDIEEVVLRNKKNGDQIRIVAYTEQFINGVELGMVPEQNKAIYAYCDLLLNIWKTNDGYFFPEEIHKNNIMLSYDSNGKIDYNKAILIDSGVFYIKMSLEKLIQFIRSQFNDVNRSIIDLELRKALSLHGIGVDEKWNIASYPPSKMFLDVLDNKGIKTSKAMTFRDVHLKNKWHRIAWILIFDQYGKIVVRQRSIQEDVESGKYDIYGGHPYAGELIKTFAYNKFLEETSVNINPDQMVQITQENKIKREVNEGTFIERAFVTVFAVELTDKQIEQLRPTISAHRHIKLSIEELKDQVKQSNCAPNIAYLVEKENFLKNIRVVTHDAIGKLNNPDNKQGPLGINWLGLKNTIRDANIIEEYFTKTIPSFFNRKEKESKSISSQQSTDGLVNGRTVNIGKAPVDNGSEIIVKWKNVVPQVPAARQDTGNVFDIDPKVHESMTNVDKKLLEEICSGTRETQDVLMQKHKDKIFIHFAEEGRQTGRTIYLKLSNSIPYRDRKISYLRIKGIRVDYKDKRVKRYVEGRGYVNQVNNIDKNGNIFHAPALTKPFGGTRASSAKHEYQLMKDAEVLQGHWKADIPIGVGILHKIPFENDVAGYIVAGMDSPDIRLSDDVKTGHWLVVEDALGNKKELDAEQSSFVMWKIGTLFRSYHESGHFHMFPHLNNIGIKYKGDKLEEIILKDLDTTIDKESLWGSEKEKVLKETGYRFLDLHYLISELSDLDDTARTKLVLSLLKGYFNELNFLSNDFTSLADACSRREFADSHKNGYVREGEKTFELNEQTRHLGILWKYIRSVTTSVDTQTQPKGTLVNFNSHPGMEVMFNTVKQSMGMFNPKNVAMKMTDKITDKCRGLREKGLLCLINKTQVYVLSPERLRLKEIEMDEKAKLGLNQVGFTGFKTFQEAEENLFRRLEIENLVEETRSVILVNGETVSIPVYFKAQDSVLNLGVVMEPVISELKDLKVSQGEIESLLPEIQSRVIKRVLYRISIDNKFAGVLEKLAGLPVELNGIGILNTDSESMVPGISTNEVNFNGKITLEFLDIDKADDLLGKTVLVDEGMKKASRRVNLLSGNEGLNEQLVKLNDAVLTDSNSGVVGMKSPFVPKYDVYKAKKERKLESITELSTKINQSMENWQEGVLLLSGLYKTGDMIDENLFDKTVFEKEIDEAKFRKFVLENKSMSKDVQKKQFIMKEILEKELQEIRKNKKIKGLRRDYVVDDKKNIAGLIRVIKNAEIEGWAGINIDFSKMEDVQEYAVKEVLEKFLSDFHSSNMSEEFTVKVILPKSLQGLARDFRAAGIIEQRKNYFDQIAKVTDSNVSIEIGAEPGTEIKTREILLNGFQDAANSGAYDVEVEHDIQYSKELSKAVLDFGDSWNSMLDNISKSVKPDPEKLFRNERNKGMNAFRGRDIAVVSNGDANFLKAVASVIGYIRENSKHRKENYESVEMAQNLNEVKSAVSNIKGLEFLGDLILPASKLFSDSQVEMSEKIFSYHNIMNYCFGVLIKMEMENNNIIFENPITREAFAIVRLNLLADPKGIPNNESGFVVPEYSRDETVEVSEQIIEKGLIPDADYATMSARMFNLLYERRFPDILEQIKNTTKSSVKVGLIQAIEAAG